MNTSAVAQATPSAHAFTQEARDAIDHAIFSHRFAKAHAEAADRICIPCGRERTGPVLGAPT